MPPSRAAHAALWTGLGLIVTGAMLLVMPFVPARAEHGTLHPPHMPLWIPTGMLLGGIALARWARVRY